MTSPPSPSAPPSESEALLRRATAPQTDPEPAPRALLAFAHQDDETVALGARLSRFGAACLMHITDGAPRNEQDSREHGFPTWSAYRDARNAELDCALKLAGIQSARRVSLDVPDQEAGFYLVDLTRRILAQITGSPFDVIFTHPYEGGHPDHDACAFAVHQAVALRAHAGPVPLIIECGFYHAGASGIETGRFLQPSADRPEVVYDLTPDEQAQKRALLRCFATQTDTLSYFALTQERFRIAPRYDFTKPPHPGPAFYDGFPWGMQTKRFCALAAEAERELADEARV